MVFKIPISVYHEIDCICCIFLWYGIEEKHKWSLVAWEKIFQEKNKGGLGLQKMKHLS